MLTVISLVSNSVSSLVDIPLVLGSPIIRSLVTRFAHVILLPRFNAEVLAYPLHILKPDVVVLAQRESHPILGQQDALEVWMIRVLHTERVVNLALEPIRRRPHGNDALDGLVFLDPDFHANVLVGFEGIK